MPHTLPVVTYAPYSGYGYGYGYGNAYPYVDPANQVGRPGSAQRELHCNRFCQDGASQWQRCPPAVVGQICTQQYDPVCDRAGRTWSNSCAACAQPGVRWFRDGPCN
jgi:hypothetical protein